MRDFGLSRPRVGWFVTLLGVAVAGGACVAQMVQPADQAPAYSPPRGIAQLDDQRIDEASGIVASRRNQDLYYINNDSGDQPRVFLVDRVGKTRLTITLSGARHVDYEDIAIAPADKPGEFDVCVADIGDNEAKRNDLVIYRFAEVDAAAHDETVSVTPRAYRISYAGGPANAEALFVHPQTGNGYIVTKRDDGAPADVYELPAPWPLRGVTKLRKVAEVKVKGRSAFERLITAADISPDGRRIALRTYVWGWEWNAGPDDDGVEFARIFERSPQRIMLAAEPQGEALCYNTDSRALVTVSEKLPTVLYEVRDDSGAH